MSPHCPPPTRGSPQRRRRARFEQNPPLATAPGEHIWHRRPAIRVAASYRLAALVGPSVARIRARHRLPRIRHRPKHGGRRVTPTWLTCTVPGVWWWHGARSPALSSPLEVTMNAGRFDALSRALPSTTRRGAVWLLAGGALGLLSRERAGAAHTGCRHHGAANITGSAVRPSARAGAGACPRVRAHRSTPGMARKAGLARIGGGNACDHPRR